MFIGHSAPEIEPLVNMLYQYYDSVKIRPGLRESYFVYNDELDLYFRINAFHLTIVRIDVGDGRTRQGIGTAILEWFIGFATDRKIPTIVIESCITKECAAFAAKHGFRPRYKEEPCFDWIIDIKGN
jgi:GNAT superfamily N-acetyltransferase